LREAASDWLELAYNAFTTRTWSASVRQLERAGLLLVVAQGRRPPRG